MGDGEPSQKQGQGRPTKYEGEKTDRIANALCEAGKTDLEIAILLGVNETTLHLWKLKHESFSKSLARAKDKVDEMVELCLLKRATGFEHVETKTVSRFSRIGESETLLEIIETAEIIKIVPPDTQAAYTWLRNRKRKDWADRQAPEEDETPLMIVNIGEVDARKSNGESNSE